MTTVFFSGSRKINRIDDKIRAYVENTMWGGGLPIVLGDADGADKALQEYLAELQYRKVTVYCSGRNCRNNIGKWKVQHVSVSPKLTGRRFYAEKDRKMAEVADYGLVLWDGKSSGSINNVMRLLGRDKEAFVYLFTEKRFYAVSNANELGELLSKRNNGMSMMKCL